MFRDRHPPGAIRSEHSTLFGGAHGRSAQTNQQTAKRPRLERMPRAVCHSEYRRGKAPRSRWWRRVLGGPAAARCCSTATARRPSTRTRVTSTPTSRRRLMPPRAPRAVLAGGTLTLTVFAATRRRHGRRRRRRLQGQVGAAHGGVRRAVPRGPGGGSRGAAAQLWLAAHRPRRSQVPTRPPLAPVRGWAMFGGGAGLRGAVGHWQVDHLPPARGVVPPAWCTRVPRAPAGHRGWPGTPTSRATTRRPTLPRGRSSQCGSARVRWSPA